jgi:hypothetical protein
MPPHRTFRLLPCLKQILHSYAKQQLQTSIDCPQLAVGSLIVSLRQKLFVGLVIFRRKNGDREDHEEVQPIACQLHQ